MYEATRPEFQQLRLRASGVPAPVEPILCSLRCSKDSKASTIVSDTSGKVLRTPSDFLGRKHCTTDQAYASIGRLLCWPSRACECRLPKTATWLLELVLGTVRRTRVCPHVLLVDFSGLVRLGGGEGRRLVRHVRQEVRLPFPRVVQGLGLCSRRCRSALGHLRRALPMTLRTRCQLTTRFLRVDGQA